MSIDPFRAVEGTPPYTKVSVTIPQQTVDAARHRAGPGGLSAYVAIAVEQQLRRDALADWATQMDVDHGPIAADELEAARALLLGYPE